MPPEMTLEQAQERILELEQQNSELTTARDNLQAERDTLSADLNNARKLNSQLLARVVEEPTEPEPTEPEPPNWEEICKSIPIK